MDKRIPSKSHFLDFQTCSVGSLLNSSCHFSFKCCISLQCHQAKLAYTFFSSNIIHFVQKKPINPIQDGLFRGCSRMGEGQKGPHSLKSVAHPTMMKLSKLIHYSKKIQKYMNHVTHSFSSGDISIFSPKISKFCHFKKCRYRLYFDT